MGLSSYIVLILYFCSLEECLSTHYVNYSLLNGDVCRLNGIRPKMLDVGRDSKSGLIVKQTFSADNWPSKLPFECKFTVKANYNMGLFAVIQKMSLRRNGLRGECIDNIQFRRSTTKKITSLLPFDEDLFKKTISERWEPKYCGELDKLHKATADVVPPDNLIPNAFANPAGSIDVKIYVGNVKLEPNQSVDVEVVFTSYQFCKDTRGAYRYCGGGACIYKEYFEDRVFNCPYKDCLDENGCSVSVTMDGMDSGFELNTRVTVTATTSIFLSFFLFLGCIWLCRYFDMLCWSAGPAPPSSEASPSAPTLELAPVASVPRTPSPDSHDKDLPPAYETLFPDR